MYESLSHEDAESLCDKNELKIIRESLGTGLESWCGDSDMPLFTQSINDKHILV